jgi:hypothetical protein
MTRLPAPILAVALAAAACLAVPSAASADVQLSMHDGRVTLKATNATVREILAEWAKVGQAKIVNGERLTGSPLTIELTNVTEGQALDVLLRTVAGYLAAPRSTPIPNGSQFDRILIMPTSTPPPPRAATPPTPSFPQPPQFTPAPPIPDDDDDDPRGIPGPGRGPVFNTFPQPVPPGGPPMPAGAPPNFPFNPGPARNPNAPATTTTPGAQMPVGVSVPGMIVPQQQQQPQPVPIQPQ